MWLGGVPEMRSALHCAAWGLLAFWVFGAGPLCWILRDGLGPDSVDSNGWHAVARFLMTFYWGPVALALLAVVVLARKRDARAERG
jgi:hypothetical protein